MIFRDFFFLGILYFLSFMISSKMTIPAIAADFFLNLPVNNFDRLRNITQREIDELEQFAQVILNYNHLSLLPTFEQERFHQNWYNLRLQNDYLIKLRCEFQPLNPNDPIEVALKEKRVVSNLETLMNDPEFMIFVNHTSKTNSLAKEYYNSLPTLMNNPEVQIRIYRTDFNHPSNLVLSLNKERLITDKTVFARLKFIKDENEWGFFLRNHFKIQDNYQYVPLEIPTEITQTFPFSNSNVKPSILPPLPQQKRNKT